MSRRTRFLLVSLAAVVGLLAGAPAVHAGPTADRAAGCGPDEVTVVVDFGVLGGGASVRCASGSPSSGLDALGRAGFGYGFRPGFPGMVCTIAAKPNPCNGAPADAYWSYWHAPAGGAWTYATQGAGSRRPAPGTVEGWAFGADLPPSVTPPSTSTPTTVPPPAPPPPAPTPTPAEAAPTPTPASPGVAPTPRPTPTDASGEPVADAPAETSTSTPSTSTPSLPGPSTSTSGTATAAAEPSAELAAQPASSSGSGPAALLGLALVTVVLAAAAWEFRRRRTG